MPLFLPFQNTDRNKMPLPVRRNSTAMMMPPSMSSTETATGQGVDEEIACLRTILQCLTNSLLSLKGELQGRDDQQLSLHDTREFLNLVVNLLESDTDPCRLKVLALDKEMTLVNVLLAYATCPVTELTPSYVNQQSFTDVGIHNIQVQCIQTLTKIITACCTAATVDPSIEATLFKVLTSMGAIDILLHFFVQPPNTVEPSNANQDIKAAAAECLFVFVSKVTDAREAVIRLRASDFFFDSFCNETVPMVRNYLCAIIKLIAETYAEHLLDVTIIERIITMLQHEQSKYVAIMLFDIISLVLGSYKSFYTARIQTSPVIIESLVQLTSAVLQRNNQFDIVSSSCGLVSTILKIEASGNGTGYSSTRQNFLEKFLELNAWRSLLIESSSISQNGLQLFSHDRSSGTESCGVTKRWETFLFLVESAITKTSIDLLYSQLIGNNSSEILHVLLHSITSDKVQEATLALLILLLKDPRWRDLLQAVPQSESEKDQLKSTLYEKLSQIDTIAYEEYFIIDINGTYMNDPVDTINYNDLAQVFSAAQFRVKGQYTTDGQHLPSPERGYYYGANNLSRKEKRIKLTTALFGYVITETFSVPATAGVCEVMQTISDRPVSYDDLNMDMLRSPSEVAAGHDIYDDAMNVGQTGPFEPESVPQVPVPHTSVVSRSTASIGNLPIAPFPGHEHLFDGSGSLVSNMPRKSSSSSRNSPSRQPASLQSSRNTSPSGWTPGQPTSFSHLSHNDILGNVARGPFIPGSNMTNVQKYAQFIGSGAIPSGEEQSIPSLPSTRRRSKTQLKKVQRWR